MKDLKEFVFNSRGFGCGRRQGSWKNDYMSAVLDIMVKTKSAKTICEIREIFYKDYDEKYSILKSTCSHFSKSTYPDKIIYECVYQHSTDNKRIDRIHQDIFFDYDEKTDSYILKPETRGLLKKKTVFFF